MSLDKDDTSTRWSQSSPLNQYQVVSSGEVDGKSSVITYGYDTSRSA
jgi:hypothetical protein